MGSGKEKYIPLLLAKTKEFRESTRDVGLAMKEGIVCVAGGKVVKETK